MNIINKTAMFCLVACFSIQAQEEYSYLWAHQYPALADPQITCCFDFVGGPEDDDLNGNILLQISPLLTFGPQESIDNQIINNDLARVWRWDVLPSSDGPIQMSILEAEVGTPALSLIARMNGITEVYVNPSPLSVFNGEITNGHMVMTSESAIGVFYNSTISSFEISQLPFNIEIPLQQARITGNLEINHSGCHGVCGDTSSGTDPSVLGAIEVSGLIHVADEINTTNQIVANCSCAGIEPNTGLLAYSEDNGSLQITCQYNSGELTPEMCGVDFTHCQNVGQQCSFAAVNANFYDVDTNKNGALDSKTVGGLMGIAGAIFVGFTDLIYSNGFE